MNKIKEIEKIIANVFGVDDDFVRNTSREYNYVVPRKVLCMVLSKRESMKQQSIAKYMGYASHSNVSIHIKTGEGWYQTDPSFRDKVDRVESKILEMFYSKKIA